MADPIMIKFRSCLASELDSREIINGSFILCSDTGDMYLDTLEGTRRRIAKQIEFLADENDRTSIILPEFDILYLVKETGKFWIYDTDWMCLNPDSEAAIIYFTIDNVLLNASSTTEVTDSRVDASASATFTAYASVYDLAEGYTITCTCGDGSITVNSNAPTKLIGSIEVASTSVTMQNATNMEF